MTRDAGRVQRCRITGSVGRVGRPLTVTAKHGLCQSAPHCEPWESALFGSSKLTLRLVSVVFSGESVPGLVTRLGPYLAALLKYQVTWLNFGSASPRAAQPAPAGASSTKYLW